MVRKEGREVRVHGRDWQQWVLSAAIRVHRQADLGVSWAWVYTRRQANVPSEEAAMTEATRLWIDERGTFWRDRGRLIPVGVNH
jgi:hypothetical protein